MSEILSYESVYDFKTFSKENLATDKYYFFMRLYDAQYKGNNICTPLSKVIKGVDVNVNDPVTSYNHAACSYKLTDDFFGLTTNTKGEEFSVNTECCEKTENNRYMSSTDITKSKFSIYAVPISKEEWEKTRNFLELELRDPKIKYSTFSLIKFITDNLGYKMAKNKFERASEDAEDLNEEEMIGNKEHLVCSTFVAYTLSRNTTYKDIFDRYGVNYNLVSPNDLANKIPGATYCCSGLFKDYNKTIRAFINKNKQFEKFYTPFLSEVKTGCLPKRK